MKYFFAILLASVLLVPAARAVEVCCIERAENGEITACKDPNPSFGHCQSHEGEEVEQSCERVPECRSRMVSCVCRLTTGDRNNAVRSCEVTSEPECQRLNQRNIASGVGTCGPEPVDADLCRECNSSADRTGCIAGTERRAAQTPSIEYRSPQLGIPIPGLPVELSKIQLEGPEGGKFLLIPWIAQYITAVVNFLLGIVLLIATVMVIVGGFMWLMAGGAPDKITDAKKRITNAVIGLTLALGTYLLLNLINPELTQFKALKIGMAERVRIAESTETSEKGEPPVRWRGSNVATYDSLLAAAAARYGIDRNWLKALMFIESGGDPNARSPAGACGLIQLLPSTAGVSCEELLDPATNIEKAALYYKSIFSRTCPSQSRLKSGAVVDCTLYNTGCQNGVPLYVNAAYNGGRGSNCASATCIDKTWWECTANNGYRETRAYVQKAQQAYDLIIANGW